MYSSNLNWISIKNNPINNTGVPDRLFCKSDIYFFVEFKSKRGVLSVAQKVYIDKLKKLNIPVFIINNFEDFKNIINAYEIITT